MEEQERKKKKKKRVLQALYLKGGDREGWSTADSQKRTPSKQGHLKDEKMWTRV